MDLKEYLETLSKEDLISLLIDLSGTNPSVDSFLTEKQSALNTQVEQNESLLSETNSLFNQPLTINRQSSPQEKIDLFKSLFSGRQDVFALRWFNSKSNKSGYSPVCGNKWIPEKCDLKKYSCATCPYKLPVALTDNYIYNHLAGKDELYRDVIGLYPLMEGNLCKFLAMDFDSHVTKNQPAWKDDILAVHKTFFNFGINSYIEISRSGKRSLKKVIHLKAKNKKDANLLIIKKRFGVLFYLLTNYQFYFYPFLVKAGLFFSDS